jgi:hypothetical protein
MPVTISPDLITGLVSFLLTVMILSYLFFGDNPFFRVAVYVFVGVSAGYTAAVAWYQVLLPRLFQPLISGSLTEKLLAVIPLLLGVLLLMKLSTHTAQLGNPSMGFLVGVGAAVAVSGALLGTLFPQAQAAFSLPSISAIVSDGTGNALIQFIFGTVSILGTISTLVYFHFGAKATPAGPQRSKLVIALAWVGQIFIAITLGVLFAGVFTAALTALIERLNFIVTFITHL